MMNTPQLDAEPKTTSARETNTSADKGSLLAPAVLGLLRNANLSDRIHTRCTLTHKHFNMPQLRNNLLWLVTVLSHLGPPFS